MINKIYEKIKNFIKLNYKFFIFLTFLIFVFYYEFPYIIYKSGGTIDLSDRVEVKTDYTQKGTFNMSYVTAMKGTLPFITLSYIMPDWDLIPIKEVTGEYDYEETLEIGKEYLNEGMDNAIISAFRTAGYGITINGTYNKVMYVDKNSQSNLLVGDIIKEIDGEKINNLNDIKNYLSTLKENDKLEIKVINDEKEYTRYATVYKDSDNTLKIGIAFKMMYDYKTEIPVTIKMKDNESGSSGSLMMALEIYNKLVEDDITKGRNIVGTGSIDSMGNVLEIGGVKYKVLAAEKRRANVFLCPKENYEEAIETKKKRDLDIEIVSVSTLDDAVNYLKNH